MCVSCSHNSLCHLLYPQSADPNFGDWFDPDDPNAKKDSPYWELNECLEHGPDTENPRPKPSAIAVLLKNTANRNHQDVKVREQTKVEADWIKKKVEAKEIPAELADYLGLDKLLLLLDQKLLDQNKEFMKSSLSLADTEKDICGKELDMLGDDPSQIDPQVLKDYVKAKVEECRDDAVLCMKEKIRAYWKDAIDGNDLSLDEGIKLAKETFAFGESGEEFASDVGFSMEAKVSASFHDDKVGPGMQIGRFSGLRTVYTNEVETLVAEYTQAFLERSKRLFAEFPLNVAMKGKINFLFFVSLSITHTSILNSSFPLYSAQDSDLDNLILGIIYLHKVEVVQPLFDNLHEKVVENKDDWSALLIEDHAHQRQDLNEKLRVLEDIIKGWKELLPDENAKKRSPPPSPAVEEARLTRSSPKRPRSD